MKKLVLCLSFCFTLFLLHSQAKLQVVLLDGTSKEFDLLSSKLTFVGEGDMTIWNNNTVSATVQLDNVRKVLLSAAPNGITPVQNNKIKMYYFDNKILLSGENTLETQQLSIFNIAGHQMLIQSLHLPTSINVSSFIPGIYFVSVNNQLMKFIK